MNGRNLAFIFLLTVSLLAMGCVQEAGSNSLNGTEGLNKAFAVGLAPTTTTQYVETLKGRTLTLYNDGVLLTEPVKKGDK